jgi:hypothetical protein
MDRLLGIKFYNELLINWHGNLFPDRQTSEMPFEIRGFQLQPGWSAFSLSRDKRFLDPDRITAFLMNLDLITGFHQERGDIDLSAVHQDVTMPDKLAGIGSRSGKTKPEHSIIQSPLQEDNEVFAGNALLAVSHFKIVPELPLHNAIDPSGFLFFTELNTIV